MEAWTDLYKELAEVIKTKTPEIEWIDLWLEQVSFLTDELPFQSPAVFISFNTMSCNDKGQLIQNCETQIEFYLFFETSSDTYVGSYNQDSAINFLRILTKLHTAFHGLCGNNFNTMRRVDMRREESGDAGNLYRISFASVLEDASAQAEYDQQSVNEVDLSKGPITRSDTTDGEPLYDIRM
ncbi:hypothetical protein ACT29H_01625 [Thermophagus sp. OGC60D27]|uniref:hypothetical protein n=1 Tax=Thermophagus sp. OGC60D27 TaxID=3458415 RepID=UPI0040382DCA